MESIEVWMWIIAGLIIGSLTLAGSYNFFNDYTQTTAISTAQKSYDSLIGSINYVCASGVGSRDEKNLIFPAITEELYSYDEELGIRGEGKVICIKIKGQEARCDTLKGCTFTMNSVYFGEDTNLYSTTQNVLGKKRVYNIKFVMSRTSNQHVNTTWEYQYVE